MDFQNFFPVTGIKYFMYQQVLYTRHLYTRSTTNTNWPISTRQLPVPSHNTRRDHRVTKSHSR
jgi:hypothetical protein